MKKIAILGATGYIGKSLVNEFLLANSGEGDQTSQIYLYVRSKEKLEKFIESLKLESSEGYNISDIENFGEENYDVVINCVGISSPATLKEKPFEIIKLTEEFDNKILNFLDNHKETMYINLSSGAAYGQNATRPVSEETPSLIDINNIKNTNLYSIAKIYTEAKHRALNHLRIIDLRVFAFFSQFADLEGGFLMSEIAKCLVEDKVFKTTSTDIVRDFIGPEDLFNIIQCLIDGENSEGVEKVHENIKNDVFDVVSKAPITKLELIDFLKAKYNLKVEIAEPTTLSLPQNQSATGDKNSYYSQSEKLERIGFVPKYSSMECIDRELKRLLTR